MNLVQLVVGAFVVGFSGAMSPGPVLAATVAESLRRGARAGPQIVAGHALLEMALVATLLAGLDRWLRMDGVRTALSIAGGAALLWMALRMAMDLRAGRLIADPGHSSLPPPSLHPVALGIVLSLSNPYWILWWATIGLAMLTPAMERGWPAVASVYAGHIFADLTWYSAVSVAVAGGRRVMPSAVRRAVALLCTLGMVWLGATFLLVGMRRAVRILSGW